MVTICYSEARIAIRAVRQSTLLSLYRDAAFHKRQADAGLLIFTRTRAGQSRLLGFRAGGHGRDLRAVRDAQDRRLQYGARRLAPKDRPRPYNRSGKMAPTLAPPKWRL